MRDVLTNAQHSLWMQVQVKATSPPTLEQAKEGRSDPIDKRDVEIKNVAHGWGTRKPF